MFKPISIWVQEKKSEEFESDWRLVILLVYHILLGRADYPAPKNHKSRNYLSKVFRTFSNLQKQPWGENF